MHQPFIFIFIDHIDFLLRLHPLEWAQIEPPTDLFPLLKQSFNIMQKYLASSLLILIPSSCLHNESDFNNLKFLLIIFIYKLQNRVLEIKILFIIIFKRYMIIKNTKLWESNLTFKNLKPIDSPEIIDVIIIFYIIVKAITL